MAWQAYIESKSPAGISRCKCGPAGAKASAQDCLKRLHRKLDNLMERSDETGWTHRTAGGTAHYRAIMEERKRYLVSTVVCMDGKLLDLPLIWKTPFGSARDAFRVLGSALDALRQEMEVSGWKLALYTVGSGRIGLIFKSTNEKHVCEAEGTVVEF